MSKSLARVTNALRAAGLDITPLEMSGETRTAAQAAEQAGCSVGQIAKSILFEAEATGALVLFITAGDNQVCPDKAAALAGSPLGRADTRKVRAVTGFAIGGVSPVGHLTAPRAFFDPALLAHAQVWAAAGTPRHIFPVAPARLAEISGAQTADFTS